MADDEEITLKAQRSLQEYEDAVQNLDPNFAEVGRKCIAALDEFINYWSNRPEHQESDSSNEVTDNDMKEFVERQLEWAQYEKERVQAQLQK